MVCKVGKFKSSEYNLTFAQNIIFLRRRFCVFNCGFFIYMIPFTFLFALMNWHEETVCCGAERQYELSTGSFIRGIVSDLSLRLLVPLAGAVHKLFKTS